MTVVNAGTAEPPAPYYLIYIAEDGTGFVRGPTAGETLGLIVRTG